MSFPVSHYPHQSGNQSRDSLLEPLTQTQTQRERETQTRQAMPTSTLGGLRALIPKKAGLFVLGASYIFDWIVLVALGVTGYIMAEVPPNKRPFWLADPTIS